MVTWPSEGQQIRDYSFDWLMSLGAMDVDEGSYCFLKIGINYAGSKYFYNIYVNRNQNTFQDQNTFTISMPMSSLVKMPASVPLKETEWWTSVSFMYENSDSFMSAPLFTADWGLGNTF